MPGLPDRNAKDPHAGRIWPTERKTKIPPAAKSVQVTEREVMYLKLTVKQKKFADEYIISGNASDAARKAGYSVKTAGVIGDENLRKPKIKTYIDERLKALEEAAIVQQNEVLRYLSSIMRGQETEQVLIGEGMGSQRIASIDVSAKDRIKAAELLGKRYAMWTDKVETTDPISITIKRKDAD